MSNRSDYRDTTIIGVDVGKAKHYAVVEKGGEHVIRKSLPNELNTLKNFFASFVKENKKVVVVTDQLGTLGANVLRASFSLEGVDIRYISTRVMSSISPLSGTNSKTDKSDAAALARVAVTHPDLLETPVDPSSPAGELIPLATTYHQTVDDHAGMVKRLRDLYTRLSPSLEQVIGPQLAKNEILQKMLSETVNPWDFLKKGKKWFVRRYKGLGGRTSAEKFARKIFHALETERPLLCGSVAATISDLETYAWPMFLKTTACMKKSLEVFLKAVKEYPLFHQLRGIRGVGDVIAGTVTAFLIGKNFRSLDALLLYAGMAPRTIQSGNSSRAVANRYRNPVLHNVLYGLGKTICARGDEFFSAVGRHSRDFLRHGAATRGRYTGKRLLRIAWKMLHDPGFVYSSAYALERFEKNAVRAWKKGVGSVAKVQKSAGVGGGVIRVDDIPLENFSEAMAFLSRVVAQLSASRKVVGSGFGSGRVLEKV